MKPKLLYDVIRQASPRKMFNNTNRYTVLRDSSPADSVKSNNSFRSRSQSIKRKNTGDDIPSQVPNVSYAAVASGPVISNTVSDLSCDEVGEITEGIVKVTSICEKVSTELSTCQVDPALVSVFSLLNEAILTLGENQKKIVSGRSNQVHQQVPAVIIDTESSNAGTQKRARKDFDDSNFVDLRTLSQLPSRSRTTTPSEDPKVKKFKEAVKEAEKSTLIFGLDLGKIPIINQDTMSTKVTKALTVKAAKCDGSNGSVPKNDTVLALDDVLSIVQNVKFYGKTTKTYKNPKDPMSGSYCTIPVRYDFLDKESRAYAETVLKEKCKVQCSVPYPAVLREASKQIVEQVKNTNPNHFVKVNIDTSSMTFKVVKRPMLAEGDKGKKTWSNACDPIPIPDACLDVTSRKAPEDFRLVLPFLDMDTGTDDDNILAAVPLPSDKSSVAKSPTRRGSSDSQKK
jgi:hypothetical protein